MNTRNAVNIGDLRRMARRRLPRFVFDFLDGGAEDEVTLAANRRAFERLQFRPRTLVGVPRRSVGASIFGSPSALPAAAAPIGLLGLVRRHGDLELAHAVTTAGIPFTLSTSSMDSLEDVARAALIITSDFPVSGKRERDLRSGFRPDARFTLRTKLDMLLHPEWLRTVALRRPRFAVVERGLGQGGSAASFLPSKMFDPTLSWADLRRFRDLWNGKLILKGVLRADDAARAMACGVDGIVLSNHGGRQLDGAISGMAALPEVKREVGGRATVLVDGGIRRGSDIAKALAAGADGVLLGRALAYGLAAGGGAGGGTGAGNSPRRAGSHAGAPGVPHAIRPHARPGDEHDARSGQGPAGRPAPLEHRCSSNHFRPISLQTVRPGGPVASSKWPETPWRDTS